MNVLRAKSHFIYPFGFKGSTKTKKKYCEKTSVATLYNLHNVLNTFSYKQYFKRIGTTERKKNQGMLAFTNLKTTE